MSRRPPARATPALALAAVLIAGAAVSAWADSNVPRDLHFVYVERDGDPFYDPLPTIPGLVRPDRQRPFAGAQLGLKDVAALGRAANANFVLDRHTLAADGDVGAEIKSDLAVGAVAILLDLPHDDIAAAAKAVPADAIALFNIRDISDDLRRDLCATALFHVMPSQAALSDALAQFVVRKNWKRVLALMGPEPEDKALVASFAASAKKFGARIVDTKPFIAGNDPREREEISTALMTGGEDYDVIYLADSTGDFGRFVPYRQIKSRLVIGSEGLEAAAWDHDSDRYGSDNVNHRFERQAGHPMSDLDWSAWVAVKAVAEAVARKKAFEPAPIAAALASGEIPIELGKGEPGSFRAWDRELRQPIELVTADAVIDYAPLEGFLHEHSTLDTLGLSEREVSCRPK